MQKAFDVGVYKPVLAVREAWRFDIGTALMRIFTNMVVIGSVSMFTLAGYSAFIAGTVASLSALACFVISPRISRLIDERGQSSVVPWATAVAMAGLLLMLVTVALGLPFWLNYPAGILLGFAPNAAAIARARWTYLVKARGEEFGVDGVNIKTVFSYEGVIDDAAFMIGPALSVALAAGIAPAAGLGFGGLCYLIGCALLLSSRSTEPTLDWSDDDAPAVSAGSAPGAVVKEKSLLFEYSQVRVLFFLMLLLGALYGVFDTSTVTYGEELGMPFAASAVLVSQAIVSLLSGMAFGAMKPAKSLLQQFLTASLLIGGAYTCLFVVRGFATFYAVAVMAALFYAPFIITMNTVCERIVPDSRLTEGITWINAGMILGSAAGPTIAGLLVDLYGSLAGLNTAAVFAVLIPLVALACRGIMKRKLG